MFFTIRQLVHTGITDFLLAILLVFEILLFKMLLLLMYAMGHQ